VLVVPCYNESEVLESSIDIIKAKFSTLISNKKIAQDSYCLLVDDGSEDNTWRLIKELSNQSSLIQGLKLSHNAGHQYALLAGMMYSYKKSDCIITIDADLQDDINAIDEMISLFRDGNEIVYGVRKSRNVDSFFKKESAKWFYKSMSFLGTKVIADHADFRLVSKRVVKELEKFTEYNLFPRAIFPSMGFKSAQVFYDRKERLLGNTKYSVKKMYSFAWEGISSFSVTPLRYITATGFITVLVSIGLSIWALYMKIIGNTTPGWTSTVIPLYFLGGVQLFSIGVIGEYLSKIYKEVKSRPRYIIEEETNLDLN